MPGTAPDAGEHEGSIPSFVTGYYLGIAEFIAFSSSSAGT
jgi:hypothetical protein